jgi:hypothetical protein
MTDRYADLRAAVSYFDSGELNGRDWIVLANPQTIRALLAERDRLLNAAQVALAWSDPDWVGYETVKSAVDAALAQEQGGSDDAHPPHN